MSDLVLADGTVLTTTEDHPYWSVDDQRFERADELSSAERVLSADRRTVRVLGLEWATGRDGWAYNLSVEGIHTYHVGADEILVHNTCGFANSVLETGHYEKHVLGIGKTGGPDMPEFSSQADYLQAAQDLMCGCAGQGVKEVVRGNGQVLRFDPTNGYFGSKTGSGVIKTFFRPDDPAGYWASEVQKAIAGGGRVTIQ